MYVLLYILFLKVCNFVCILNVLFMVFCLFRIQSPLTLSLYVMKQNKKERKKVREVGILKKDPETLREQIDKLNMMSKSSSRWSSLK